MNRLYDIVKKKEVLIFDFDGVLADSVEVKTEAFAELYRKFGKKFELKVVNHHRANGGMSRFDKFRHYHEHFLNRSISNQEVVDLSKQFSDLVVDKVVCSPPIKGAVEFLDKFCHTKTCVVNSATPENEIKNIIIRRNWGNYFKLVHGSPTSKMENLMKIMFSLKVDKKQCVFFGDANSDADAAKSTNIDFVGISGKKTNQFENAILNLYDFTSVHSCYKL